MKWSECRRMNIAKKCRVDEKLVFALIESSERMLATDKFAPLNEITASTKVANHYNALREVLSAIAISRGFKIYNHDCLVGFIVEVLKMPREANNFDRLRRIRNGINYLGKNIDVKGARGDIEDIERLRVKFLRVLDE